MLNRPASAHFIGGITIGDVPTRGLSIAFQRVFGYRGTHLIDVIVMPANPGVNPTLMITGLAERSERGWRAATLTSGRSARRARGDPQ